MKILIVDDHPLIRMALSKLLKLASWPETVILESGNGHEALEVLSINPGIEVMLLDVSMPEMNGIELLQRLKKQEHTPATIVLSQFESPALIAQMISLGAKGFLLKNVSPDDLFKAIETAARGEFYDNDLFQEWRRANPLIKLPGKLTLTNRDYDLVYFLKQGKSTKEISVSLSLSVRTIESYRKKLLKKTGTKNVAELITLLFESGIMTNQLRHPQVTQKNC